MFNKINKRLREISVHDDATSERLLVKTTEELGELAEAINWSTGYKNTIKTKDEIKDAICEEGVDAIICILAIFEKENIDDENISNEFKKKLKKYKSKVVKKEIIT